MKTRTAIVLTPSPAYYKGQIIKVHAKPENGYYTPYVESFLECAGIEISEDRLKFKDTNPEYFLWKYK